MYCLICPEARRRKTFEEWAGICGVCKNLSREDIEYLYWIQEQSPEHAVIAPIKLRNSQFASRRRYEAVWEHVPDGKRVLEIGSATALGLEFAQGSREYVAMDVALDELRYAKRVRPGLRTLQADGARIPFGSSHFDIAMLMDVIEHMPTSALLEVLKETARVLVGGGQLILSTPSGEVTIAKRLLGQKVHLTHVVEYASDNLAAHLRQAGFKDIVLHDMKFPHFPYSVAGRIAQNIIPEFPWLMNSTAAVTRRLGYYNVLCFCTKI